MNLGIGLLVVILMFLCEHLGYRGGMKRGKIEGYRQGRIDAELWWTYTEQQVDQARQKLWKENT